MMIKRGMPLSGIVGRVNVVPVGRGWWLSAWPGNRVVIGMQHLYCLSAALAERV
jgi:hypothetical protein